MAIMFSALFDRSCAGRSSDVAQTDLSECRIVKQGFMVTNYVSGCRRRDVIHVGF